MSRAAADMQTPLRGTLNLDHVAHFVPDIGAAGDALERLGFTLTPFSPQSHRLTPDGPLVSAGTGNRCVMLEHGYLEFLTPTDDTPIAGQLRAAIERYIGVHLMAFGTADADLDYARLEEQSFKPIDPVKLQRPIKTQTGEDVARFTVVRVPPGTMAEGRIQFCQHHTPQLLWQRRWLEHSNGARGLSGVIMCVADPRDAAQRYGRYSGIEPSERGDEWRIIMSRGVLSFVSSSDFERRFGATAPALPWIAGCRIESADIEVTRAHLDKCGQPVRKLDDGSIVFVLPPALGGLMIFEPSLQN